MPELAEDAEVVADEPAPEPKAARQPATSARNRAKVVPEEALAPPAPPTPIVKPGTLRRDITKLQRENVPRDEAIHALQREVADLKAVIANICDQLGVNGPKQRSQKSA